MVRENAENLLDYCRRTLGEHLRAITYYSPDEHDPLFTRTGVAEEIQLDENTRAMFRYPLVQLQRAVWQLTNVHPTLEEPVVSNVTYRNISVIQFPITRDEGIVVTLDSAGKLPDNFESNCKSILNGSDESAIL